LNATTLTFRPQTPPKGGNYLFDVQDAAKGGSAGAVTLIVQAILYPLLFAIEPSRVTLRGGTQVPFSPPYHYLAKVTLPALARLGVSVTPQLRAWGWYPAGGGEIALDVTPLEQLQAQAFPPVPVTAVSGVAAVTNLPAHIPQRMARRAHNLLQQQDLRASVDPVRARGAGPGAGIILWVPQAGFSSLGRIGLPADQVAETAVAQLLAFMDNKAAVDPFLADQLLLPLALAQGRATYTTSALTAHTNTNAQLLRRWLDVKITIKGKLGRPAEITTQGIGFCRE
jgi:RNA 3'-terminal phosphate cyclase (ATP)